MTNKIKAVRFGQLIVSLLVLATFISCEESGTIGAGFVDESQIIVDTVFVTELPLTTTDPFLGKLTYSPVGRFSDPLFGNIEAIGLFKPSIIKGDLGDIPSNAEVKLRLNIDIDNVYGNQTPNGTFQVFRVNDLWRGSAYKMSDEVEILRATGGPIQNEVGEFKYSDIDTTGFVEFTLEGNWKTDYIEFFNNDDEDRDSVYRFEDFGLALFPDEDVDKVTYTRFSTSRLLIIDSEQDTTTNILLDWAYDISVEGGTTPDGNITLSNTFNPFLTINFSPIIDRLTNNNFVRAELVLTPDAATLSTSLTSGQERTENPPFRIQLGPSDDIAYDLGFNATNSLATFEDDVYRFDITGLFNAAIFGDTDISEIYLYGGQNNGILGFNTFFGPNSDLNLVPKILVYNLVEEVE